MYPTIGVLDLLPIVKSVKSDVYYASNCYMHQNPMNFKLSFMKIAFGFVVTDRFIYERNRCLRLFPQHYNIVSCTTHVVIVNFI